MGEALIVRRGGGASKKELIAALTDMEVPLTGDESTSELVAMIREIIVGDVTVPLFEASITDGQALSAFVPVSYFETTENFSFLNHSTVEKCNLIKTLEIVIKSSGECAGVVNSDGWVLSSSDATQATFQHTCPERVTKFKAADILSGATVAFSGYGSLDINVYAYDENGNKYTANGTTRAVVSASNSWLVFEPRYDSWAELNGTTWQEISNLRKAGI